MIKEWKYYNHAMISARAPHESPDVNDTHDPLFWKNASGKMSVLARWTSNFDCGIETNWWYCIKDDAYNISDLKAKRRYEIHKARKNFTVKRIDPSEYVSQIIEVQRKAYSAYPSKYRPKFNCREVATELVNAGKHPEKFQYLGAFDNKNQLCAYSVVTLFQNFCILTSLRSDPQKEYLGVNAAMVDGILSRIEFTDGYYICDGERNILHETHFQDYLEKYFGFRKAYCNLHIRYNPRISWIIKVLYPIRKILTCFDGNHLIHNVNGVLKMEEIVRENKS